MGLVSYKCKAKGCHKYAVGRCVHRDIKPVFGRLLTDKHRRSKQCKTPVCEHHSVGNDEQLYCIPHTPAGWVASA